MIDAKTIRDWVLIILVLVFVPESNRTIMNDLVPSDWYGEFYIPIDGQTVIIAKNSSKSNVLPIAGPSDSIPFVAIQSGQPIGVELERGAMVPPLSIAILVEGKTSKELEKRTVWRDKKYYFNPGKLKLLTNADLYSAYLAATVVIVGFMTLGFLLARFGVEDGFETTHKEQ